MEANIPVPGKLLNAIYGENLEKFALQLDSFAGPVVHLPLQTKLLNSTYNGYRR